MVQSLQFSEGEIIGTVQLESSALEPTTERTFRLRIVNGQLQTEQVGGASTADEVQPASTSFHCVLEGGGPSITIGPLTLEATPWWDAVTAMTLPSSDLSNAALDALLPMASWDPRVAIKSAALADAAGIPGVLGQVLDAAGEHMTAGCVLGAASIAAFNTPSAR